MKRLGVFPCALEVSNVFTSSHNGWSPRPRRRSFEINESRGTPFKDPNSGGDSDVVINRPHGCLLVASAELELHVTRQRFESAVTLFLLT